MAGSYLQGIAAAKTNKDKYGSNYYAKIGAKGGSKGSKDGTIKGFAANPELARTAGALGGRISRKPKK